ncbi:hypothetical protein [Nocardia cyriacigeorgica]|uniref:Uncharacterized protein n=1 Tax=Nocardia cyriacigeorgica TaxID=135487 RepID=A0A5R8NXC4_9NOCA|nr:hypothetical protein [Nocardia cyriacigeorgica]TLF79418.1 hypothetical protein FEK34_08650 [Nocardia cyriacigeorgica]
MTGREEARRCYALARKESRTPPLRTEPDTAAIARLTRARNELWAAFHAAEEQGRSRAQEEFLAWHPGPMRLHPATWALGKRCAMLLIPRRYTWSEDRQRSARLAARHEFEQDYFRRHGQSFYARSEQIDAELERAREPETRPHAWEQMREAVAVLYRDEEMSVEEIADYLGEDPLHVGNLLQLVRVPGPLGKGHEWLPSSSFGHFLPYSAGRYSGGRGGSSIGGNLGGGFSGGV